MGSHSGPSFYLISWSPMLLLFEPKATLQTQWVVISCSLDSHILAAPISKPLWRVRQISDVVTAMRQTPKTGPPYYYVSVRASRKPIPNASVNEAPIQFRKEGPKPSQSRSSRASGPTGKTAGPLLGLF